MKQLVKVCLLGFLQSFFGPLPLGVTNITVITLVAKNEAYLAFSQLHKIIRKPVALASRNINTHVR